MRGQQRPRSPDQSTLLERKDVSQSIVGNGGTEMALSVGSAELELLADLFVGRGGILGSHLSCRRR
jgi:hypothetical protein